MAAGLPSCYVCAAGLLALATAMGIGRFAFTPMLPLMIGAGSADVVAGGWLAAPIISGSIGVNAKRPMPIAVARASSPAAQTARREGRGTTRDRFDMGLD